MMTVPMLDLQAQYAAIGDRIESAVVEVLRSGRYILGPRVSALEEACARYCEVPFAVGVSSGTDALLMALMALEIGPGDEVVTTTFSFFATAGAIERVGARPVFVDIEAGTFNIDPAGVRAAITPRTRAIIVVHLFGQCADMGPLLDIAAGHGIAVIEDAAQSIGARRDGRAAGSMGTIGCFSFFPSKNLGAAGDGGLVTTSDPGLAERLRILRDHGAKPRYFHHVVGGNFRLDEIQAAILLVKLEYLDGWIASRQANAARYMELLEPAAAAGRLALPVESPGGRHVWNQFTVRLPDNRALVAVALDDAGIGHAVYYPRCLHQQDCFAGLGGQVGDCPVAERATAEVLSIPVYPELSGGAISAVADTILGAVGLGR